MSLSDEERLILDFEGKVFKYQGAKEVAIRGLFGNVTHYYQRLAHLLDREDALAYAALLAVGSTHAARTERRGPAKKRGTYPFTVDKPHTRG